MTKKIKKNYPNWWKSACNDLSKKDQIMGSLIVKYPHGKISTIKNPFYSLSRCIVGQQISVQAAEAVWKRIDEKFDVYNSSCFQNFESKNFKSLGISQRKANYLVTLSNYMHNNNSFTFWNSLKEDEIFSRLISLKGIGPWSIKMFLMFSLNRRDIFSSEDLGLIKALGNNYFHGRIPSKEEAESFALRWSPWRTVACWFLWRSIDPELVTY